MTDTQRKNLENLCEALESGRYEQGKFRLKDDKDRFCCLGVGLDLIDPTGWRETPCGGGKIIDHLLGSASSSGNDLDLCKNGFMAKKALEHYGLTPKDQSVLSGKNDSDMTFCGIAKYIRETIIANSGV